VVAVPILASVTSVGEHAETEADSHEDAREWEAEFDAAARRPLRTRMRYAFIHTYKPVLDDAAYRSFDSLEDYRAWCDGSLPSWLGYGREV